MPAAETVESPTIAIVGGGPAGLMLSHLLARRGVDSIVLDHRSRTEIEHTHRAGILEADSVRLLVDTGVSDRVLRDGDEHEGIDLRFSGRSHRIHFNRVAPELIYCRSERGFALISQRTPTIQRMYLQCEPGMAPDAWSDEQIWEEFAARLAGEDDLTLPTGPIIDRAVLGFRSFVQEPMHYGRLVLAGDAAHTVPPTGAKGLNLALADVSVLVGCIEDWLGSGSDDALAAYTPTALQRVWRAQNFSYWMTQLLHTTSGRSDGAVGDFAAMRQLGELDTVVSSRAGRTYLAECYTGWPQR